MCYYQNFTNRCFLYPRMNPLYLNTFLFTSGAGLLYGGRHVFLQLPKPKATPASVMFGRGGRVEGYSAATCNITTRCDLILNIDELQVLDLW